MESTDQGDTTTTTTQSAWACLRQAHKGLSHRDIAGTREETPHPLPSHGTSIWLGSNMKKNGVRLFSVTTYTAGY